MMKRIKYILAILLSINLIACDNVDFGDINKNVNGASEPYTAGLLSNAIMAYAQYSGRNGLTKPTLYVQYQVQVTYVDEMLYAEQQASWFTYYITSLEGLQTVIDFVSNPDNVNPALLSQGSVANQMGVAMIMKSIIMKRVTDTYGDVPYSQALTGAENLTPVYDTQESIYKGLIDDLKAGRDMLNATENAPSGDIIYDGDVTKWQKLANSYIMYAAITLSKQYPSAGGYAATEFNAALNDSHGAIETVADEAWFSYDDIYPNPWNANRTPDYFLSREFTDALNGNATANNRTSNHTFDARINVYADDPTAPGVPYGFRSGSGAGASSVSNDYYWNNLTPLPLMTASYTYLNRADAANMGWTTETASTMLSDGITMSYRSLENLTSVAAEVEQDASLAQTLDETAYLAARMTDAGTVGMGQVIAEEKWVSLFGMGFAAWTEWRRTGYPDLLPPTLEFFNDGTIPRRYLYPIEENTLNGTNYDDAVSRLNPGSDHNYSRVWWDK